MTKCRLRCNKLERIKDYLLLEQEFVEEQIEYKKMKGEAESTKQQKDEFDKIQEIRGMPMIVGNLDEFVGDNHAIVSSQSGPEFYVPIMSFVDREQLEPNSTILCHSRSTITLGNCDWEQHKRLWGLWRTKRTLCSM